MSTTFDTQRLLGDARTAAERAGVFGAVELAGATLRCKAKDAAADAWYVLAAEPRGLVVRLVTPDRWLSESIEADLMHHGDPMEELIEEELVDLGHDAARDGDMPTVKHFRSDDRLYTFENVVPLERARDAADAGAMATRFLLAYEAAFRELGDMAGADEEA